MADTPPRRPASFTASAIPDAPNNRVGLTPRQYAAEWSVDVATVYRWVAKGAVDVIRAPSGRLRILGIRGRTR